MFNEPFYSRLGSSGRKKEWARERETREGRGKAHAWIVSRPQSSWQPLRDLPKILTENELPRTNKACRQKEWYILLF